MKDTETSISYKEWIPASVRIHTGAGWKIGCALPRTTASAGMTERKTVSHNALCRFIVGQAVGGNQLAQSPYFLEGLGERFVETLVVIEDRF
jgi:hypothetical protein